MNFRSCIACLVLIVTSLPAWSQQYQIRPMGLYDAEHTDPSGISGNSGVLLNNNWAVGLSSRFSGTGDPLGNSIYAHNLATNTTTNITITSGDHTGADGYRQSNIYYLDAQGNAVIQAFLINGVGEATSWNLHLPTMTYTQLALTGTGYASPNGKQFSVVETLSPIGELNGWTNRYVGENDGGRDPWIFNRQTLTTTRYGLIDAAHTSDVGYRYSTIGGKSASGIVYGSSERYDGTNTQRGTTAWLHQGGVYTTLGLDDAEHTHHNGFTANSPAGFNSNDVVLGNATRYLGGSSILGNTTWLYFPTSSTYRRIGLFGAANYRPSDGTIENRGGFINDDVILGHVYQYAGPTNNETNVNWIHRISTNTTTRLGLFDAEHTGEAGFQDGYLGTYSANFIVGTAARFAPDFTNKGFSSWIYNLSTNSTTRIGLTNTEHTSASGVQYNGVDRVNNNGLAYGSAWRFKPGSEDYHGQSVWVHRSATNQTTRVGLTSSEYTRDDGYQYSAILFMTESGWVAGFSERFLGGPDGLGYSSFVYDSVTNSSYTLRFSVRPSDQYSATNITALNEDGSVFGYYQLFDSLSNNLGEHAFRWSVAQGFEQISDLVLGGLPANNWSMLNIIDGSDGNNLYGRGVYDNMEGNPFLLVAVPEAKEYMLAAVVLAVPMGWYLRRRWLHRASEMVLEQSC